ncbi:MAG: hypothetical protein CL850_04735 [Crocinitomicaceae bacterium]|nr:hypothetical protein [Crocinitomicaceae bacterium]
MDRIVSLFSILILASSCAKVGVPTGGEKDSTPPIVVNASPKLGATNVNPTSGGILEFEFDEYVNVSQLSAQLLVSPPLAKPLEWKMKGRKVQFIWNEELKQNRTYIFQFGDAIEDLNEKNPASDLTHAFSTGPDLDTLSITGTVVDVFSGEPQSQRRIFVYDWELPVDSILSGSQPLFVTSTDSFGSFTVRYMPEGKYRLLAIEDVDRNYVWTDGESLAIHKEPIQLNSADTLSVELLMQKTDDIDVKYFMNVERDSLGLLEIELSGELDNIDEIEANSLNKFGSENSLLLWSDPHTVENSTVIWSGADTLIVKEEKMNSPLEFSLIKSPEGKQVSSKEAAFTFSRPITFLNPHLFKLTKADSTEIEIKSIQVSEENPLQLIVEAPFGRGDIVELSMLPKSIEGHGKKILADTLIIKWSTFKLDELSELIVDVDATGWIELISANGTIVKKVAIEKGIPPLKFKNLTPGSYSLRWLGDSNSNGVWDGVSLKEWRLPEPASEMATTIKLKADWIHEISWDTYE